MGGPRHQALQNYCSQDILQIISHVSPMASGSRPHLRPSLPPSIFVHLGSSRLTSVLRLMDQISKPKNGVKDHFRATLKSFKLDEFYVLDIPLSSSVHSTVSPSNHMIQSIPFPSTLHSVLDSSPMGFLLPCLHDRHRHSPGLTQILMSKNRNGRVLPDNCLYSSLLVHPFS